MDILVGNRGLTTALAIKAIEALAPVSLEMGIDEFRAVGIQV